MKRAALGAGGLLLLALAAGAASTACAKSPLMPVPLCGPHDTVCQSQKAAIEDPSCKNGTASNAKCLDPRAP